ncbi:MAG: hypothetical protein Q9M13_00675 [Mariprofundales bacterium]|nr:hypothetical protein [Mariprofundales bacterium]
MLVAPSYAGAAPPADEIKRGAVIAQVRCQPCHFLTKRQRRLGPGLLGIYNRTPSITGLPFNVWSDETLDLWLTNPRAVKINTKMYLPPLNRRDRRAVIAWLRQNR